MGFILCIGYDDSSISPEAPFTGMGYLSSLHGYVSLFPENWHEITYPFPTVNGCIVEVLERISNFIAHFIIDVITYPGWD